MKRILIAAAAISVIAAPLTGAYAQAGHRFATLDLTRRIESVTVTATRMTPDTVTTATTTAAVEAPK